MVLRLQHHLRTTSLRDTEATKCVSTGNSYSCATHQDCSVHLVAVCFHLGVGNSVVVQHRLQVGPVGRQVREQNPLHGLEPSKTIRTRRDAPVGELHEQPKYEKNSDLLVRKI